jgi:hypothetical protein
VPAQAGLSDTYRTVGSGGSFVAAPFQRHIGLGKSARIQTLEVWWPSSDTWQSFSKVDKNQVIEIREGDKTFTSAQHKSFRLGARRTRPQTNGQSLPRQSPHPVSIP